jgi:hypothetical protein
MGAIVSQCDAEIDQETFRNTKSNQELFTSAMWKEEDPDSIHNDLLCLRWSDQNAASRATRKSLVEFVDTVQDENITIKKVNFQRSCNSLILNEIGKNKNQGGHTLRRWKSCDDNS